MLTGKAKKDYQRGYMRIYMRNRRAVKTQSKTDENVKTLPDSVKTRVKTQIPPCPKGENESSWNYNHREMVH